MKADSSPVEVKGQAAPQSFQRGRAAYRIKDYKKAQDEFEQAVYEDPTHQWSWLQLANAQRKCGDLQAPVHTLQMLTTKVPYFVEGWRNLGILHEQNGDLEKARNAYERMLAADPANTESVKLLTELLIRTQSLDDAESLLRSATHALGKQHQSSCLWLQMGRLMAKRGDSLRAFKSLHNASLLDANNPDIQLPKVALLLEFAQPEAALETINTLLKAHPSNLDILQRKAEILQFLSREQESLSICEQGLAKDPERMDLLLLQIYASMAICDWRDQDSQLAMIIKVLKQRGADESSGGEPYRPIPPFGLLKLPLPAALMRQEIDRWVLANGQGSAAFQAKPMNPVANGHQRPLRIGYLSADFRSHAMGLLLEGLFEAHDSAQAETFAYSISPIRDRVTDHFKATADHFHELHGRRDAESIEQIQRDELDVLIDLSGLTTFSRPAIVCARPAPLLLGYLGFPGSQGAHYVDGILADDHLIPVDLTDDYSETVWRLPVCFVAKHRAALQGVTRSSLGLPENAFVYCCFNRAEKINEEIFDCWLNILLEVSNSVLWISLKPAAHLHLQARAVARGVDPNRLIVAAYQKPVDRFISAMGCADLFLDTPEFNAGAIGVLALNAGLPLLTLPGQRFTSRMGASLCCSTGLSHMVMADLKDYEQRAIELAGSPNEIKTLKSHLQHQPENLPLFQQRRWVNDLVQLIHRA
ncbi:MAG: tetratricopeptide repeat protein [Prochlorococcus sp.]